MRASRRGPRSGLRRRLASVSARARGALVLLALLGLSALGVEWEAGAAGLGLAARFLLHAWILAVVVGTLLLARRIRAHWDHESFAFGVAFALMLALGGLTDALIF